jgi:hypothetical protein
MMHRGQGLILIVTNFWQIMLMGAWRAMYA